MQKSDKYMRHFHRKAKDTDGQDKPMWRTRWSAPDNQWGNATHPPVLLVSNQVGTRPALKQMEKVAALTREQRQGQGADGFHLYKERMPIVATTLELLREHGPARARVPALRREDRQKPLGRDRQPPPGRRPRLPRRRRAAPRSAGSRRTRGLAPGVRGTKFTNDRWKAGTAVDWGRGDSPPHLCDDCKARALEAERQAEQAERERQKQERQQAEAAQDSKADGWLHSNAGAADPGKPPRQREGLPRAAWANLVVGGGCEADRHGQRR